MDALQYFATQSPITDPGDRADLLTVLPKTVPGICEAIQNLCLDFKEIYKYPIQNERLLDTNSRYVNAILGRIVKLNKAPLDVARPIDGRFTASSSDFVSLFCALMRMNGTAARKRSGFIACDDGTYLSHDTAEYWDAAAACWQKVDPSGLDITKFVPAAQAWQSCRAGKTVPEIYKNEEHQGLEVVRSGLMLDLASMNKLELLLWDRYGWMVRPFSDFSEKAWSILDQVAELLNSGDKALDELQALYAREEGLQVPEVVFCDSPVTPPHKVTLTF